ncbi:MAG: DnaJ domain-containing protein [Pyrinomonadaceae bacterium]|nr:DnaJ domain-containing protein [Phycisphaerales bacterium]
MPHDAFDILGLSPRFDLPPGSLQSAYLALSAKLHPDTAAPDIEAELQSAKLNEARRVLENPESRADLLLRRLGGPGKEQDKSLPHGFLAEMLEVREEIDAAIRSGDPDKIAPWDDWAGQRRKQHIAEVARLFSAVVAATANTEVAPGPDTHASPDLLKSIRAELNMWRYIERLVEQLHEV